MRSVGNILKVPEGQEKNVSTFKTISFLISSSENDPVTNFPDHQTKDESDRAHVSHLRGN
jgi:hypothetical protein